jgi:hypothetical protein
MVRSEAQRRRGLDTAHPRPEYSQADARPPHRPPTLGPSPEPLMHFDAHQPVIDDLEARILTIRDSL